MFDPKIKVMTVAALLFLYRSWVHLCAERFDLKLSMPLGNIETDHCHRVGIVFLFVRAFCVQQMERLLMDRIHSSIRAFALAFAKLLLLICVQKLGTLAP